MKYFTLLVALCATFFTTMLVAQPTSSATAPTQASADVISIFSGAYTNLAGTNFFPSWGQGTTYSEYTIAMTSDVTKRYAALDYEGIEFASSINASSMTTMHWDIWTDVATTLRIFIIAGAGGGERYVTKTTAVGWNSYDIPLTDYTSQGLSVSNIIQFKFEENPMAYQAGTKTVYLDNIYFWKPANVPTLSGFTVPAKVVGDPAFMLTAPTSPSSGAFTYTSSNMSVATISGSTVTILAAGTSTITVNQAADGSYAAGTTSAALVVSSPGPATAAPTPTPLAANVTSLFSNAYTNVGVDTWSTSWDQADVTDVMIAGNDTKKYTNHLFSGIEFTTTVINATTRTHFHADVWTADAAGADGFKVRLVDFGANGVYDGGDDAVSIELPFTPTASGWFAVDVPLTSFTGLTTKAHLAQLIFVTPGGSKTFWVDNVYLYTSAVPTEPTTAATTPTLPQTNVISLFSNAYTNRTVDTWRTNWSSAALTDMQVAGNDVKKYTGLGFFGAEFTSSTINTVNATHFHLDVWAPNAIAAGVFKVKLVDFGADGTGFGPVDNTEGEVLNLPAIAAGTWTALDIPLSDFAARGLASTEHLAQLIPSGGGTVFMDNIYFYANAILAVELTTVKAKAVNTTTVLTWQTASEKDNAGFTIERSTNATDFTAIGNVKGNGTTNATSHYTFTDATPSNGVNYYRLRQADFNGKETFSKVVAVLFGKTAGLVLRNTLVHDALDVVVSEAEFGPLSIFNVSGQLVYSVKVQGTQRIDVSHLTAGVYIVRTATGEAKRFVKN